MKQSDPGCGLDYDFWHLYHTATGSIRVKVNPFSNFNPFHFQPDVTVGSNIA